MAVTIADVSGLESTDWLSFHASLSMLKFGHDRQVLCHWATSPALWTSVLKHPFLTVQWRGDAHAHAWRSEDSPVVLVLSFHISVESGDQTHVDGALEASASIGQTQFSFLYFPLLNCFWEWHVNCFPDFCFQNLIFPHYQCSFQFPISVWRVRLETEWS